MPFLPGEALKQRLPETSRQNPAGKRRRGRTQPVVGLVTTPARSSDVPAIQVLINGRKATAIVDSGANCNFLRPQFVRDRLRSAPDASLASTDGILPIDGRTTATIGFDATDGVRSEFLVSSKVRYDAILGVPWLQQQHATLDFDRCCLHLGQQQRRTVFWETRQASTRSRGEAKKPLPEVQHDFPAPYAERFRKIAANFGEIFEEKLVNPTTRSTEHRIDLLDTKPFRIPPYRYSPEKKKIICEQIEEMLSAGVIEPSMSQFSSPIVLAKKKDGRSRFCVDYRRLNKQTRDLPSDLPIITDAIRELGPAKVFSTIDLRTGYWQIKLEDNSKKYTAFTTPDGAAYQFRVLPFGLKGAPTTFQRFMVQEVLAGYIHQFAMVYLDDIIVYSRDLEEHLGHLQLIFERLQKHNLTCATDKCHFGMKQLDYLGHVIGPEDNTPQDVHLHRLQDFPEPQNRKQLRSFLGACNWLRDYIPRFAEMSAPLTELLSAKKRWRWTPETTEAFQKVKTAFSAPLKLHRPDFTQPFVLQTDASSLGIAAVLYQEVNGRRNIISYSSAKLSPTEKKYHSNEQELLAVIFGVKKYRPYLEDRRFLLRTDNRALKWLETMRDARSKLARWALLLQQFVFDVEHTPGTHNELADALSRHPAHHETPPGVTSEPSMLPPTSQPLERIEPLLMNAEEDPPAPPPSLVQEVLERQTADPEMQRIIAKWMDRRDRGPQEPGDATFLEIYTVRNGHLYRIFTERELLVVSTNLQERILYAFHDHPLAAHPGTAETLRAIQQHFFWPSMEKTVDQYVRNCWICTCTKRGPHQARVPLRPHEPREPWVTVAIDIMGPYTTTPRGNRFIMVATDLYSRWVEAEATPNVTTDKLVNFLDQVFLRYGYPLSVLSDNGTQFTSVAFNRALRRWGAAQWTTPIYHPRSNPTERRNQEIKKGLRAQLFDEDHASWDLELPKVLFAIRSRRNAATGYTPAEVLMGRNLRRADVGQLEHPVDLPEARQEKLRRLRASGYRNQQAYQRRRYPRQRQPQVVFQQNDPVLVKALTARGPFAARWRGPFPVLQREGATTYIVDVGGTATKYHADQLRAFRVRRRPARRQRPE